MQTGIENAVTEILRNIKNVYDNYENRTAQMSQEKRKKVGAQIDKQQKLLMDEIMRLEPKLADLSADMQKSAALKKAEFNGCRPLVNECLGEIQTIIKKKNLLFKVNNSLMKLVRSTDEQVKQIKDHLGIAGETKFLCCGTDGVAKFLSIMQKFKLSHAQWSLLAKLEPKDSVQTFISPEFSANNFAFIREILRKCWPQDTVKVEVKQVIKQVSTGKPSRLILANDYIYGINKQSNPSYGLKIYHEEAQSDPVACSYLGQVYEQGTLLPKDLRKSTSYYKKAMEGKEPYAFYRYAMALIKGELRDKGVNLEDIETGRKLLEKVAFADNPCPEALIQLGQLYEKGSFEVDKDKQYKVSIDLRRAIECYLKARSMNVPRASNNLGVLYINHKTMSQSNPNSQNNDEANQYANLQKGVKYLEEAQELGFAQAFFNMGYVYENGILGRKNPQEALMSYYKGGLKGDVESRLKFAYQLMNQTSILKQQYEDHYRIAIQWLESIVYKVDLLSQSAVVTSRIGQTNSLRKAQALFYLGLMYEYGFGVDKSPKKAFNYYAESSELGYSAATNKIGDCYFSGFGIRQDRKLAIGCYANAEKMGNSDAMVNLGTIYLNGIPGLIQRNYNLAYQYFLKANKLENSNALIHMSYMYKNGLGLPSDLEMAKKLLSKSAIEKNPTALYMLKEIGGEYDDKVLFHNLDNQMFVTPSKINLKEVVPYISNIKI